MGPPGFATGKPQDPVTLVDGKRVFVRGRGLTGERFTVAQRGGRGDGQVPSGTTTRESRVTIVTGGKGDTEHEVSRKRPIICFSRTGPSTGTRLRRPLRPLDFDGEMVGVKSTLSRVASQRGLRPTPSWSGLDSS